MPDVPDEDFDRFFVMIQTSDTPPFYPRTDAARVEVDRIVTAITTGPYQYIQRMASPGVYEIEIHVPKK